MRIVFWQTILIKYHTFFSKKGKVLQILSSAAVVIGALRVKVSYIRFAFRCVLLFLKTISFYLMKMKNIIFYYGILFGTLLFANKYMFAGFSYN